MRQKRFISLITASAMSMSLFSTFAGMLTVSAEDTTYTCDFTQLVKNSANTAYGTADDVIALDDYTTAHLTSENAYTSPSTTWDFGTAPATEAVANEPYITGNAGYDETNSEIKFPADTTASGYLTVDFDKPIKNNVEFSFKYTGHDKALGQQFFNYRAVNSEGDEIVSFRAHPYNSASAYIKVNGTAIENCTPALPGNGSKTVTTSIDYNALQLKVAIDSTEYTASIPESLVKDVAKIEISGTRSKTAGSRYISVDDLTVSEFTSTEPTAAVTITNGYTEATIAGVRSRVKVPGDIGLPLVVYLSGASRFGTDNYSQLYNAQYLFGLFDGNAVLAAPQTETAWDTDKLAAYIAEAKTTYGASSVVVAGQFEGAGAAYELAKLGAADKIIPIAGTSDITATTAKVWAFGGFTDDVTSIADIRTPVNVLQKAGVDVRYTEYPTDGHSIAEKAAAQTGLSDWILGATNDPKVVDLVIFSGQSNMAGRGTATAAIECPAGCGYEFHSITDPSLAGTDVPYVLSTVTEPFGKTDNNNTLNDAGSNGVDRRAGDMVSALMKAYYDRTGVAMVGVQASRGGQLSAFFTGSVINAEMAARFSAAENYLTSAGYTIRKKAVVWCQGEADADSNKGESTYKGNTLTIWNNFKAMGITEMFIVKTGHYNINYGVAEGGSPSEDALTLDSRYANVNAWQQEFADANDDVYVVGNLYTDEYLAQMRDQYHYYQPVYNAVGTAAGAAIAEVYKDVPTPTAAPTPAPTDIPGADYSWDFTTDQTASSGNNVPLISGTATYDETNRNIKLSSETSTAGEVKVNLSPAAEGVVSADFDMYFGHLSRLNHVITASDSGGKEIVNITVDVYNGTGTLKIGGETVATDSEFEQYINSYRGDGMNAAVTHFNITVNYPKRTAAVTITKNSTTGETFTGSLSADTYTAKDVSVVSVKSVHGKYTTGRDSYLDNLAISSYTPSTTMYATGAASVTKRLGRSVTEQYSLSRTYFDSSETAEWSVTGVTDVTINKDTGVLTVPETAATGTATVTVTLTQGGTLPTGTSDRIEVEIKDFASPASYTIGGARTIETGKTAKLTVENVTDTDGNDITSYTAISGFASSDTSVATVDGSGNITAVGAGTANVTYTLTVSALGYSKSITEPVKVGAFELTTSAASIDVSSLISYGADTYRVYQGKVSTEVTASGSMITNPYSGSVTVVPVYRFNYTNAAMDGYTTATGAYTAAAGYGLLSGQSYSTNANGSLPQGAATLHIDLPYGNYDMNILRKGGARTDVHCDGIQIINNTTSNGSQNRPSGSGLMYAPQVLVSDGAADITVTGTSGSNERIATVEIVRVPDAYEKHVIWVAGDSESANYFPIDADGDDLESDKIMMTGFGMQLGKFLSDDYYKVANWGQPSATVRTWSDECFESVLYRMEEGDTIIVDFGINEGASSSNAISESVMQGYMEEIFEAAKAKGVQPILVSPLWNSKYQSKSKHTYNAATETNSMYAFAEACGVPCIDLNKGTMLYKDAAIAATGDSSWVAHNYHVGDSLHQTQHSAVLCAAIIAGGMKQLGYVTTDFADVYNDISDFDATDNTKRGTESGVSRIYSIAALADYIFVNGEIPVTPDGIMIDGSIVTVKLADTESAILVRARFDENGKLMNAKTYDLTFTDGAVALEIDDLAEGDVLYLWDSLNDMNPLLEKTSVKGAGETPVPPATEEPTEKPIVPTATPTTIPTATPTPTPAVLYSQDFENYSGGDTAGWTSPAGTMAIKSDQTSGIGKYQTVVSGKSGTCRSGYIEIGEITKNFVFECDYKSSSNTNVSDLELVENKNSIYANHGVYSNANFVFTMARPRSSDLYVINNKADDSGFTLTSYTDPVFTTKEIANNPWMHVKVIGNFDTQTVRVMITSLDGNTEYYDGVHDMNVGRGKNITSWKCIHLLSPSTGADTCIDNILVTEARESDLAFAYHKVNFTIGSVSFDQYVLDGKHVVNIPSTSIYGDSFEGWRIGDNVYTTEQLAALPITAAANIEGQINDNYIEDLSTVEFNDFPAGGELVMGADENTYGDNPISLTITGEQGTSLVTNPDARVSDYAINWTFDGFRTLDGAATGETGSLYCDSYGLVEITEAAQSAVNFKLKKTSANYWGRVRASVTYNGKTIEIEKPLMLLGDKNSSYILPKAGYPSDYNKFEDSMVDYRFTTGDVLGGGWSTAGSDGTYMDLKSDSAGKYLSLSRAASGNSSYVYQMIGNITGQTVFEQDVRFGISGTIRYGGGSNTSISSEAFAFAKSGSNLTFNGVTLYSSASASTWYHIVITADPTTQLASAKAYDMSGNLLGESGTVAFSGSYTSGNYYHITLEKNRNSSIDLNNVKICAAETDAATIAITAPATAAIPDSGNTEVTLSATASTTDGNAAIGLVDWAIADELAEGVTIESTGNNTSKLTISSNAASGNLPIRASIGGKSKTVTIKLTGTKNNVAFVTAPVGIRLGAAGEYTYEAELRNGNAEAIEGNITYSLANAEGTAVTVPGVTIDSATGKLSVAANTEPQTIYVKAVSGEYSKLVKTVLYALKFSFGTGAPASGFTKIENTSVYSDSKGYGIEGAALNGADGMTGSSVFFKVKLEKGKVYEVRATYNGTIRYERIDSRFTGFERTTTSLTSDTYNVAVFGDDIMDIMLKDGTTLAAVEITEVNKTAAAKPDWWTIGDSTVQQNGSWGYTIASTSTTDLSKYPELAAKISGFHNSGKAGEQHTNFYTNGRLNSILTQMNPGDVVSISGMGTNDSSSSKEQFKAYDEMYVNAILDMSGRVILGSYTPTGNYGATQGRVYDADTMTFKGMRTNAYDLAIRELYEEIKDNENVLGFVDIGKMADEKMTADVRAAYAAAGNDPSAAQAKAEEMMAWWKDYNHYYSTFSDYLLPDITKAVAELIK